MFIPACGRRRAAQLGKCPASERALQQAVVSAAGAPAQDLQKLFEQRGTDIIKQMQRCRDKSASAAESRMAAPWKLHGFRRENGASDGARTRDLRRDRPAL